jgi:hypothetical protein
LARAAGLALAILGALLVGATGASAASPVASRATCPSTNPYPGDSASRADIAVWMSRGAVATGLPGELPVMAAIVESNLRNVSSGDADSVGYFGMRTSIWNNGPYAGFPTNPTLQLKWFTDQAIKVRDKRISDGRPDPTLDDAEWGEWIADVERPAEQYRGRYQLRLQEARDLIGAPCTPVGTPAPPELTLRGRPTQKLGDGVAVSLLCDVDCTATAKGRLRLPHGAGTVTLSRASGSYAAGDTKLKLELGLSSEGLRQARRAARDGGTIKAKLRVVAAGSDGLEAEGKRTVTLTP